MSGTGPVAVGFIGAGMISDTYLENLTRFPDVSVVIVGAATSDAHGSRPRSTRWRSGAPALAAARSRLGVTKDWVWAQARAGRIPHVRLGRYCRFREEAIEAWVIQLESAPPASHNGHVSRLGA